MRADEDLPPLLVAGSAIAVRLRRSARATRMSLRVDPQERSVVVVLPPHVPASHGLAFATSQRDWVAARLTALPERIPFASGVELPLLGTPHRLSHAPVGRRGVWAEDGMIHVSGSAEFFERRVRDWLRLRATSEITARALPMAAEIGKPVGRISLRDTRSRWGSCTSRGDLAFSWRLVLAPAQVLTYVVAHEVAHLSQMNHSPAFWGIVGKLMPEAMAARSWLKRHGAQLHRYG